MYFIGYSKWLLLSSRLVAGDHSSTLHVHSKITPQTCVDVVFPYQFVWCVSFRCRCRSRLFHFRFPDSQHTARGASRDLCCHHGLSTSWPSCRSVSPTPLLTSFVLWEMSDSFVKSFVMCRSRSIKPPRCISCVSTPFLSLKRFFLCL